MAKPALQAFLALGATALLLLAPPLLLGARASDSGPFNQVWTSQLADGLARGELYPRWLPHSFEGLGSPTFYFYPPLAHGLAAALHLLGFSTPRAIAMAAFVLLLASGGAMYAWLRSRSGHALLASCLYMAALYHLTDFYVRGGLAEFAAFVWLPLIALAIEAQPKRWAGPLLAAAFAGLIVTHLPTTVLASCFLIAPMVAWRSLRRKDLRLAARAGAWLALGAAMASLYWLPALTLQGHVNMGAMWSPYFQPSSWSLLAPSPAIGGGRLILYTMALLAVPWTILALGARHRFWTPLSITVAILSTGTPSVLWLLPGLDRVQFPWRALTLLEFCAITAFALAPMRHGFAKTALATAALPIALLAAPAVVAFSHRVAPHVERAAPDAPEYLPAGFPFPGRAGVAYAPAPELLARYPALVNGPVVHVESRPDGEITFEVTQAGRVVVRRAAFPIWRVTANGREVAQAQGPLIAFEVAPGRYRIARQPLGVERVASAISAGAWSVFALLVLLAHPIRRRSGLLEPPPIGDAAR
jgi:hypothetical protein